MKVENSWYVLVLLFLCTCSQPEHEIELGSLNLSAFTTGYGEIVVNRSVTGKPLSIGGISYEKGIGVHANSEAHILLDGKGGCFSAFVGIDDNAGRDSVSTVAFYIFAGDLPVFSSGTMRKGDAPKQINISLKGVTDLYLIAESTSDGNEADYANWAEAKFVVSTPPVIIHDKEEERYILTPEPSDSQRINGAKVVGASPGKPFLFTIATTGERPIRFVAKNLPDMKRLTTYIHDLGMKAGLYSSPGKTTCGGYAGSLGYEAVDIQTFADWGFDFLKYDWCSYEQEVQSPVTPEDFRKPYLLAGKLCKQADRDMVLNMCQYGMGEVWKWGKEVGGQSWRTTDDIGDTRNLIANMFRIGFFQEQLREYAGPGGWNDPDYLLFGDIYDWDNKVLKQSPYSASEHYTCMTLWCMMSAPLIFSGDITTLDDFTRNILCNAEVIAINQDKLGRQGYSIYNKDLIEIWKKELADGSTALAVFNKRPFRSIVKVDWEQLGYKADCSVRDTWRQVDIGVTKDIESFGIPCHGCMLFRISK